MDQLTNLFYNKDSSNSYYDDMNALEFLNKKEESIKNIKSLNNEINNIKDELNKFIKKYGN